MQEKDKEGIVMRCVLALESRVNSIYDFLGKKIDDEPDANAFSVGGKENEQRAFEQELEEEDDVFGHRAWIEEHNKLTMGNQTFEENK